MLSFFVSSRLSDLGYPCRGWVPLQKLRMLGNEQGTLLVFSIIYARST